MRYCILLLIYSFSAHAQTQLHDAVREVEETRLQFFQQNPFDINLVTAEELQGLHLFSENQLRSFWAYRISHGPFISIHELQIISGWDPETLRKTVGILTCETPQKKWYQGEQASQQLLVKFERTLEEKVGFSLPTVRSKTRYIGNPWTQNIRYRGKLNRTIRAGFTLQKDAGESDISDFKSFYLEVKPQKWVDKLILGDFINQWGQGLIQSGGFSLGKTYESIRATQKFNLGGLPYSSSGESAFYRGMSLQAHWGPVTFATFQSARYLDASISKDSLNRPFYRSIDVDGNHRTSTELSNKSSITEYAWGFQALVPIAQGYISFSSTQHQWSIPKRNTQVYNQTEWQGDQLTNYAIAHHIPWKNVFLAGEFASTNSNAFACIESIAFPISQKLDFSTLLRYYGAGYFSPMAQSLGESSQTKNELGIFVGNQFQISKYQRLSSYIDYFHFPKRNFTYAFNGAWGVEILTRFQWDRKKKGHYFSQLKWTNQSIESNQRKNHIQASFDLHRDLIRHVKWHSRLMLSYLVSPVQNELGAIWLHDIQYSRRNWKLQTRIAWVHTPSYDTRLYAFEPTLAYSFSLPAYYDPSMRNLALLSFTPTKHWELGIKIARTQYFEKETSGSGLDLIPKSHKTDIGLQLIYQY